MSSDETDMVRVFGPDEGGDAWTALDAGQGVTDRTAKATTSQQHDTDDPHGRSDWYEPPYPPTHHNTTLMRQEPEVYPNESAVLPQKAGAVTPTALLGFKSMTDYHTDDDSSDAECPTCGETFPTDVGMKRHHTQVHGERLTAVTVSCAWCGADIERIPANLSDERNFCDRECNGAWMSANNTGKDHPSWDGGKVTVSCTNCGETIERTPGHLGSGERGHFCCRECYGEWMSKNLTGKDNPTWVEKLELTCDYCGAEFERYECDMVGEMTFCQGQCQKDWISENVNGKDHPLFQGGSHPYGPGFTDAKKEQVRERQDRVCAGCGEPESDQRRRLAVHHIQKAREIPDEAERNDTSNLVALCDSCHMGWEQMTPLRPQTPYFDGIGDTDG
jgi:endogenous inhibitor of DNA gyrase (YacG/DUF329 family)